MGRLALPVACHPLLTSSSKPRPPPIHVRNGQRSEHTIPGFASDSQSQPHSNCPCPKGTWILWRRRRPKPYDTSRWMHRDGYSCPPKDYRSPPPRPACFGAVPICLSRCPYFPFPFSFWHLATPAGSSERLCTDATANDCRCCPDTRPRCAESRNNAQLGFVVPVHVRSVTMFATSRPPTATAPVLLPHLLPLADTLSLPPLHYTRLLHCRMSYCIRQSAALVLTSTSEAVDSLQVTSTSQSWASRIPSADADARRTLTPPPRRS